MNALRGLSSREIALLSELDQSRLDVSVRRKISRLPWRGQFPPELVDYLIDRVCFDSKILLDPFCGSGTVLFEALARGKAGIGLEVNPAAWHLATLATLGHARAQIKPVFNRIRAVTSASLPLFDSLNLVADIVEEASQLSHQKSVRQALAAVVLLATGDSASAPKLDNIAKSAAWVSSLIDEVAESSATATCELADARYTGLDDESVDGIVTSPPYINVFNYHQNYRIAVEKLGWSPLQAASSEIGANRKNRGNRFLTVIQYCIDMAEFLNEASRVLRLDAPIILVVGRSSNVLGAPFKNGSLMNSLLTNSAAFGWSSTAERSFVNRFGDRIYEDLIMAQRVGTGLISRKFARSIAVDALKSSTARVPERNLAALHEAIARAENVLPSPKLSLTRPVAFA